MNSEIIDLLTKLNEKKVFLFQPKSLMILISPNHNSSLEKLSLENVLEILNKDSKSFIYTNDTNIKKKFLNIYTKSDKNEKIIYLTLFFQNG